MTDDDKYLVAMVERASKIINYIYEKKTPVKIAEISSNLGIAKATVYRILYTLKKFGYIEQDENDEYLLGLAFVVYGSYIQSNLDIKKIAKPYMEKLADLSGESVNLGIYYKDSVVTIEDVKGEDFYLVSRLIPVSPLNCSSMGKLYLSDYSEEDLETYFKEEKFEKRTINSIIKIEEFREDRENILKTGLSYDIEEYEYGLTCIARGLRDENGNLLATISVSGPSTRLKFKGIEKIEASLMEISQELEANINKYLKMN